MPGRTARALLGTTWRQSLLRLGLLVAVSALALSAWPALRALDRVRRPGGDALDVFERAGITELTSGQRGPALRLRRLSGGEAELADFRDKLVVLNFWATWCTPCKLEMPALQSLWTAYRKQGLVVIGVAEDRDAPHAVLAHYVAQLGLTFPTLLDPDQRASEAWRVTGLPTTFLIRPGGEVAGMAVGAREWASDDMRALVEHLLRGGSAGRPDRRDERPGPRTTWAR